MPPVNLQQLNPHSYARVSMHHKKWPRPEAVKDWEKWVFESYDGVQFYVPRAKLPYWCPVSELFKQPDGDAHMVHRFLTLIVYGRLEGRPKHVTDDMIRALCKGNDGDEDDFDPTECGPTTFRDLIQFLRRQSFTAKDQWIAAAAECLREDGDAQNDEEGSFSAVQIFLAGAELDDVELCALALRRRTYTKGVSAIDLQSYRAGAFLSADGYHVLHPTGMAYQIFVEIPTAAKRIGEVLEEFP